MMHRLRRAPFLCLALFSAVLAGFAFGLVLEASPRLHEWAHHHHHDSRGDDGDDCLVTTLAAGGYEAAAPAPVLVHFLAELCEVAPVDRSREVQSLFLGFRLLEHAPPRRA